MTAAVVVVVVVDLLESYSSICSAPFAFDLVAVCFVAVDSKRLVTVACINSSYSFDYLSFGD